MRLLGVGHAIPSMRVGNDDILRELRAQSSTLAGADELARIEAATVRFLETSGTEYRYVLAPGERAIDFALQAGAAAIRDADIDPDDIGFVIFAGVARGSLDPATANVVQAGLRLRNATCFDVSDGCASWIRAMDVAQRFVDAGSHRAGLIVNAECGLRQYADFQIRDLRHLELRLAAFTVGEAATATVVGADPASSWHFVFKNFPDRYDLCMLALPGWEDWVLEAAKTPYVPGRFLALSRDLIPLVVRRIVEVFRSDDLLPRLEYDIILGHAASERASAAVLKRLGISHDRYFPTHTRYGNTVSAATPLAIRLAADEGRLRRGDRVLAIVGGAGISIGIATFHY